VQHLDVPRGDVAVEAKKIRRHIRGREQREIRNDHHPKIAMRV